MDVTAEEEEVVPIRLPPGGRDIPVTSKDGTRLHVTVFGSDDAPALVLMHGFSQQQLTWAYQVQDLADEYRVIVYDQRGHGRSGWSTDYSMEALGDDLHAVLDATLRPRERAVLAGHSMGGITIMSWAKRYPGEVAKRAAAALLVNTASSEIGIHLGAIGVPRRMHPMAKYVVRKRLMALVRTRARRPIRLIAFGADAHPEHVDEVVRLLGVASTRTLRSFVESLSDMDLTSALPSITCPTVVIAGGRDRLLPPVHNRRMGPRLPNLERMIMMPAGGHMGRWEYRDVVSNAIRDAAVQHLP